MAPRGGDITRRRAPHACRVVVGRRRRRRALHCARAGGVELRDRTYPHGTLAAAQNVTCSSLLVSGERSHTRQCAAWGRGLLDNHSPRYTTSDERQLANTNTQVTYNDTSKRHSLWILQRQTTSSSSSSSTAPTPAAMPLCRLWTEHDESPGGACEVVPAHDAAGSPLLGLLTRSTHTLKALAPHAQVGIHETRHPSQTSC